MNKCKTALMLCLLLATAGSCNLLDPFDSPTSDAQLISAARACFDRGDMECARANYAKLSSAQSDIANSETAFSLLADQGVTMAVFMQSIGAGQGGSGLTEMAGLLSANGTSGATRRQAIYDAYKKVASITAAELKGLVRFTAAFALAAEILSEDVTTSGSLKTTDLASAPATCKALTGVTCVGAASCVRGSSKIVAQAKTSFAMTSDSSLPATAVFAGAPSWGMFAAAIDAVNQGLSSTELNAGGNFGSGTGGLSDALAQNASTDNACFRYGLLSNSVGI